ncbi:hypothetical protein VP06_00985 [Methylobacterium aquaticum]|uniref:Methyl-accepting chemotaxis protein n=2 Tax=Methylobacterium aquaticum TaxID=270351 RepID=A0A0J6T611_9HYPH|nr:hypothetical protein VP06_00985 [Methylobacterium aquaticum]
MDPAASRFSPAGAGLHGAKQISPTWSPVRRLVGGIVGQVAAAATKLQATAANMTDGATQTAGRSTAVAVAAGTAGHMCALSEAARAGAAATQVLAASSELSRQSEQLSAELTRFLATVRAA